MSTAALALVLAAAFLHAGWNLKLHQSQDGLAAATAGGMLGTLLLLPMVVLAPPFHVWPLAMFSGLAEAVYFIFLSSAYQRGELSFTYPIARGTAPILATMVAGTTGCSRSPEPTEDPSRTRTRRSRLVALHVEGEERGMPAPLARRRTRFSRPSPSSARPPGAKVGDRRGPQDRGRTLLPL